jgi:hypothetical protein
MNTYRVQMARTDLGRDKKMVPAKTESVGGLATLKRKTRSWRGVWFLPLTIDKGG